MFPQGFSCLVVLWILSRFGSFRIRGFHPSRRSFQFRSATNLHRFYSPNPRCKHLVWALPRSLAATYGITCCFLFLRLLRCFSSPGSLRIPMYSVYGDRSLSCRVAPFRYLRIFVYLPLPVAFRSLSRLSSALSTKASALRPT